MSSPFTSNYPLASEDELKKEFVGKQLRDVQAPVPVIDVSVAKQNCEAMLKTAEQLGVSFRAHIKTHKVKTPSSEIEYERSMSKCASFGKDIVAVEYQRFVHSTTHFAMQARLLQNQFRSQFNVRQSIY